MRKVVFAPGEYYHIYNRGVDKRAVFMDKNDHERFIKLLFLCNSTRPVNLSNIPRGLTFKDMLDRRGKVVVDIGAYCLMPNHFHLLVRAKADGGISNFMQKIMTAYTMYFNIRNARKGSLFETSFQVRHANSDEYLKHLFAYIHLNPLKIIDPEWKVTATKNLARNINYLSGYNYSSYLDYLNIGRDESLVLNREAFPDYFLTAKESKEELMSWLKYEG